MFALDTDMIATFVIIHYVYVGVRVRIGSQYHFLVVLGDYI